MIVDNDNNNIDSSDLESLRLQESMYIHKTQNNIGFSGGSNEGVFNAKALFEFDWVITLNPDAFVKPDWFEMLMRAANEAPEYDMLSSTLLRYDDPNILDGAGDVYSIYGIAWRGGQGHRLSVLSSRENQCGALKGFPVLGPCGAAAAYRADAFIAAGGFDPAFFCYLEDVDLALRLQLKGHKCLQCIDAKVLHIGSLSSALTDDEVLKFKYYYTYKNQLRLMIKTMPLLILTFMLPVYLICLSWIVFRTRGERQSKEKLNGLRDGFKSLGKTLTVRKKIQAERSLSLIKVLQLLVWSPKKLSNKSIR